MKGRLAVISFLGVMIIGCAVEQQSIHPSAILTSANTASPQTSSDKEVTARSDTGDTMKELQQLYHCILRQEQREYDRQQDGD